MTLLLLPVVAILCKHTTCVPNNHIFDAVVHNAWIKKTVQKHVTDF